MKKVTIYEVSAFSNVSLATVSRVINGSDKVKQSTKDKVNDAIKKLGYKPSSIAKGLAMSKSTTIGLVISDASDLLVGMALNGLIDVSKIYKYNIQLHTISEGIVDINSIIDNLISSSVEGAIIFTNKELNDSIKILDEYNIPVVLIGTNEINSQNVASVSIDYYNAIYKTCFKYIENNKKNIALVHDRRNLNVSNIMKNVKDQIKKDFKVDLSYIDATYDDISTYKYLTKHLVENKYDLVICNRDSQAMACLNAARENNIKVPKQLEIICLNDTKYNSIVRPEISSFKMPAYDLGAIAMRTITKMLLKDKSFQKNINLNLIYRERNSTLKEKK